MTKNGTRSVLIIINPAAGQPEPVLHTLNQVFAGTGVEWQVAITKKAGDAAREVERATQTNLDAIAVYGGDGTVTEVANALHGSPIPMAILPGGTANLLSVELGIPRDLEGAARLLTDLSARIRPVDMGHMDNQLFFHLSLGILGNLINRTDRAAKDQSGLLAYVFAGFREL